MKKYNLSSIAVYSKFKFSEASIHCFWGGKYDKLWTMQNYGSGIIKNGLDVEGTYKIYNDNGKTMDGGTMDWGFCHFIHLLYSFT